MKNKNFYHIFGIDDLFDSLEVLKKFQIKF
jgi:hypothetical protein